MLYNVYMAELKTKVNKGDVKKFIESVDHDTRREDGFALLEIFNKITKKKPKMWGTSIIGYDQYHYKSERSSQEGDWPMVGFSPRKQSLSLYVLTGFKEQEELLSKLGKHKKGSGCLYINKLSDVDEAVLKDIIKKSYAHMKAQHK